MRTRLKTYGKKAHYTELDPLPHGIVLWEEWEAYRRAAPRLLSEGQEGKYILIHGSTIVGVWDTEGQAESEVLRRDLDGSYFIYSIQPEVPFIRLPRRVLACLS